MTWIPALLKGIWDIGARWIQRKQKKSELLQEKELAALQNDADWDKMQAIASQSSWKDEWFVLIFSIPLLTIMVAPIWEVLFLSDTYVEGSLLKAAIDGLEALDRAPDWYVICVLVMVAASFGYKKLAEYGMGRGK